MPPRLFVRLAPLLGAAALAAAGVVVARAERAEARPVELRSEAERVADATLELASASPSAASTLAPRDKRLLDRPPRALELRLELSTSGKGADLLLPFRDASIERLGPLRSYTSGPWGTWLSRPWSALSWSLDARTDDEAAPPPAQADAPRADSSLAESFLVDATFRLEPDRRLLADRAWLRALEPPRLDLLDHTGPSLRSDGLDGLFRLPPAPVRDWRCRRSPVLVARAGGESQRFELVRCDGSAAPEALDRLSVLARPHDATAPGLLLPDEPDPSSWQSAREWAPGIRVVHPRLLWVLQKLADAFPRRAIVLYSGYRPFAEVNDGSGHRSLHASGRALDVAVHKTSNAEVFKACRELKDVGCGFYPNGKFVHVDVRRAGSGKAFWIDASAPGEPTRYVDAWPGVVESGGLAWRAPD